jgi:hypothetical protein
LCPWLERTLPLALKIRLKFLFERDFSTFYIHFFPLGNRQTVGKKTEDHTKGEVRLLSGVRARALLLESWAVSVLQLAVRVSRSGSWAAILSLPVGDQDWWLEAFG